MPTSRRTAKRKRSASEEELDQPQPQRRKLGDDAPALALRLPGLGALVHTLHSLLTAARTPPPIYVYGPAGCGKTTLARSVSQIAAGERACYIDLAELSAERMLYERVLRVFHGHALTPASGFAPAQRCDTLADFVWGLSRVPAGAPRRVLVLDGAERLEALSGAPGGRLLAALLRLAELATCDIAVVLIGSMPFEALRPARGGCREPLALYVAPPDRAACLAALALHRPAHAEPELHAQLASLLYDVFCRCCRDTSELIHIADALYDHYAAPVRAGRLAASDTAGLYRHAAPLMKALLDRAFLRDISASEWRQATEAALQAAAAASAGPRLAPPPPPVVLAGAELPTTAKFVLMAAYLASYNPAKLDAVLFTRHSAARRSRKGRARAGARTPAPAPSQLVRAASAADASRDMPQTLIGPQSFGLERLLAIFNTIVEDRTLAADSASVMHTLMTLVSLHLVRLASPLAALSAARFRVSVPLEAASAIGQSVGFDIRRFMHDA